MAINPNPVTVFTRGTPNDGLLFQSEFARLYANDQDLENQIAAGVATSTKLNIELSHRLGQFIMLPIQETEAVWNPSTPETYTPMICLTKIDVNRDVAVANFPDYVPYLRAIQIVYRRGKSDEVSTWSASVSGSVVTMPNNTSSNRLLVALAKWVLARGSYATWITLTIGGIEYVITNINTVTREITVSGTPASGTQNVTFYPHRIAGSSTTARVHEVSGKTMIAGGDAAGLFISGLQCLGYVQGHHHEATNNEPANVQVGTLGDGPNASWLRQNVPSAASRLQATTIITDGTNGTPRTSSETHSPALVGELHQWTRSYVVP